MRNQMRLKAARLSGFLLLLCCIFSYGKDIKPEDLTLSFTVVESRDLAAEGVARGEIRPIVSDSCRMTVRSSDDHVFVIGDSAWNCRNFNPGAHLSGRLARYGGQRAVELGFYDNKKGKHQFKTHKYYIRREVYLGR
jgi:hypothetical protein